MFYQQIFESVDSESENGKQTKVFMISDIGTLEWKRFVDESDSLASMNTSMSKSGTKSSSNSSQINSSTTESTNSVLDDRGPECK